MTVSDGVSNVPLRYLPIRFISVNARLHARCQFLGFDTLQRLLQRAGKARQSLVPFIYSHLRCRKCILYVFTGGGLTQAASPVHVTLLT